MLLQTVALTTTILARPFIEPDAARAPSTPSHLERKSPPAVLDRFANPIDAVPKESSKNVL
jgi:hypothetical protein